MKVEASSMNCYQLESSFVENPSGTVVVWKELGFISYRMNVH